jgi:hypothetical protein
MIYDKKTNLTGNVDDPEFHQKIIDALPIPIFYRDLNGVYQMCNNPTSSGNRYLNFIRKKQQKSISSATMSYNSTPANRFMKHR